VTVVVVEAAVGGATAAVVVEVPELVVVDVAGGRDEDEDEGEDEQPATVSAAARGRTRRSLAVSMCPLDRRGAREVANKIPKGCPRAGTGSPTVRFPGWSFPSGSVVSRS
jgi:hypothetical protein